MKKLFSLMVLFMAVSLSAGCAKHITTYSPPNAYAIKNSRVFDAPYDKVWKATVDAIATSFWTLDNIEKDSGILTLSYACKDATPYVDCGKIHNIVIYGQQDIEFEAATPQIMLKAATQGGQVWEVERKVSLSVKSNVLVKKSKRTPNKSDC